MRYGGATTQNSKIPFSSYIESRGFFMSFNALLVLIGTMSIDAFVLAASYGAAREKMQFRHLLIISGVSAISFAISLLVGSLMSEAIPPGWENYVDAVILGTIGITKLAARKKESAYSLSTGNTFLAAVAVAFDCLAAGLGVGKTEYSILLLAFLALLSNWLFSWIGNRLGFAVAGLSDMRLDKLGGFLFLILAACKIIFKDQL